MCLQDKPINSGKILAVEFINKGKLHKAVRYKDSNNQESYYSPDGQSLQKAFIRNPVNFTRISSHFTTARRHPILHKIRSHKGVDYAAPTGTPIRTVGDGEVIAVSYSKSNGNFIKIKHNSVYTTAYLHMSRLVWYSILGG